jgi:hypothetical protein
MAYIRLDVLVLQVESLTIQESTKAYKNSREDAYMFPDVNTNDRDVAIQWVLVSSGDDFQSLDLGVQALQNRERFSVSEVTIHLGQRKHTSQPQPLPWIEAVVVLKVFLKLSTEPKYLMICS